MADGNDEDKMDQNEPRGARGGEGETLNTIKKRFETVLKCLL